MLYPRARRRLNIVNKPFLQNPFGEITLPNKTPPRFFCWNWHSDSKKQMELQKDLEK